MEIKVEALMDNLAMAVMQANGLAADSPEYGALAERIAYALDLTDLALSAESNAFGSIEPPKTR